MIAEAFEKLPAEEKMKYEVLSASEKQNAKQMRHQLGVRGQVKTNWQVYVEEVGCLVAGSVPTRCVSVLLGALLRCIRCAREQCVQSPWQQCTLYTHVQQARSRTARAPGGTWFAACLSVCTSTCTRTDSIHLGRASVCVCVCVCVCVRACALLRVCVLLLVAVVRLGFRGWKGGFGGPARLSPTCTSRRTDAGPASNPE
jgi:hypothetical protein